MKLIYIERAANQPGLLRLQYVLNFLNAHPLCPAQLSFTLCKTENHNSIFYYGTSAAPGDFQMPCVTDFWVNGPIDTASYQANVYRHLDQTIHSVEVDTQPSGAFCVNRHFQFDVFSTIFFHISRYEEVFANEADHGPAGWLRESKHFLIRHHLAAQPVIDQLVAAFFQIFVPERQVPPTTYSISHDVDILGRFTPSRKFWLSLAASLFRPQLRKNITANWQYFQKMQRGEVKDPYDYFDILFRQESFWQHKQVYLMMGGETNYDNHYDPADPRVAELIRLARSRGYQIGLHPSYNAGFKEALLQKEQERLTQFTGMLPTANRQHFLRFDWQKTPTILVKNNVEIDSSLGYTRHLGFRSGTGFSYQLYNFSTENAFNWQERPLVLMDSAALHQARRIKVSASELITDFIQKNGVGTHVEMNFHNSNFDPLLAEGRNLNEFYEVMLLSLVNKSVPD